MSVQFQFTPRMNIDISSPEMSELIESHKNRLHKQMKYVLVIFGSFGLIGLVLLGTSFAFPKCKNDMDSCQTTGTVLLILGLTLLGTSLFLLLIGGGCGYYKLKQQFNDLKDSEYRKQLCIWRLNGEEWIHYLNYIYGPDRQWLEVAPLSCFCCRRSTYDRLINRQYGHIIFYRNGLIIDELYFVSFRTYSFRGVQLLNMGERQQMLGLRIHTRIRAGNHSRNCYFDVLVPSSVTSTQLQALAESYTGKISGSNLFHAPLQGLDLV